MLNAFPPFRVGSAGRLINSLSLPLSVGILTQTMDAAPHLGTTADLEMRTARVADPALGAHLAIPLLNIHNVVL